MILVVVVAALVSPGLVQSRAATWKASSERQIAESRRSGDPDRPALGEVPILGDRLPKPSDLPMSVQALMQAARPASVNETFIDIEAPVIAAERNCDVVFARPAGVTRASDLRFSGHILIADCGSYWFETHEQDYRQPLTQTVTIGLPAEAANLDLGPGRAMADFRVAADRRLGARVWWTDGEREVEVVAASEPRDDAGSWNRGIVAIARRLVAVRLRD